MRKMIVTLDLEAMRQCGRPPMYTDSVGPVGSDRAASRQLLATLWELIGGPHHDWPNTNPLESGEILASCPHMSNLQARPAFEGPVPNPDDVLIAWQVVP